MQLTFEPADLDDTEVVAFLQAHLSDLAPESPLESQHALDLDGLRTEGVRLWVGRIEVAVVATGALSALAPGHEELKSMRTDPTLRGNGLGRQMLDHLLCDARDRGVRQVSLETGSADFFAPARNLYRGAGFRECPPFGTYVEDPHSAYFTLAL